MSKSSSTKTLENRKLISDFENEDLDIHEAPNGGINIRSLRNFDIRTFEEMAFFYESCVKIHKYFKD